MVGRVIRHYTKSIKRRIVMKPFKRIFKKKTEMPTFRTPVKGITEAEYNMLSGKMAELYNEAAARQKEGTTKPSGYMKGISAALDVLGSIMPHDIEVA
jgi:hypothetical protein